MSSTVGKEPSNLTQAEITWLVNVANAGVDFIKQGDTTKAERILTDIGNHFTLGAPAPAAATAPELEDGAAKPMILCSQCTKYLPNEVLYIECLGDCTN